MKFARNTNPPRGFWLVLACSLSVALFAMSAIGCSSGTTDQPNTSSADPVEKVEPQDSSTADSRTDEITYHHNRRIANSLIIGLDADMSSGSAQAGLAIERGVVLAIDEINASGGLLDRPVELIVRDHRGNPDRGVDNIDEFSAMSDVLAIVGGLHTPVAIRELPSIHDHKMIYLGPWAAGTPVVQNGFSPNYIFRVSVRDEYAGGFLVDRALERGLSKMGLLLERTAWGRSNEKAMQNALIDRGKGKAHVEWFNLGEKDMTPQLGRLNESDVDCVLMVCNPLEGKLILESMASVEATSRVPLISHWGITGGDFFEMTKNLLDEVDFSFIQTCSFLRPETTNGLDRLHAAYAKKFEGCDSPSDVFSPVGTAHAYEIVMMLAAAVKSADTTERPAIRDALENLGKYEGVIRNYEPPFTPKRHDALELRDLTLAKFGKNGAIEPIISTTDGSGDDEARNE